MHIVFIGIGSNLGDSKKNCISSIKHIQEFANIRNVSSLYETEPIGKVDQPDFINCVIEIETELDPYELLTRLQSIENKLGRVREQRWGARTIDLDIIFYDDLIIDTGGLKIPHPEAHNRRFVLEPLREIAPDLIHPEAKLNISEILAGLENYSKVIKTDTLSTIHPQISTTHKHE